MRIGELARHAGVTAKTIRYYESIGLMDDAPRHANGYRDYDESALERLQFIRDAQAAGLTLAETGEIVGMKAAGESTCSHTRALLDRHLAEIDLQIERLLAAKSELVAMSRRADALDPGECNDPARCQVIEAGRAAGGHGEHGVGHRSHLGATIPVRAGA